jgi:CRISPR-associated endonuclease/helicase Cas3
MLPSPHLLFWAKLGSETWPGKYHPVACHLIDVGAVARKIWDHVFRPRIRQWLSGRLGLDESACGRWLAFWSGAHDIRKMAPCFQDRGKQNTAALRERLGNAWFALFGGNEPHGVLSTKIVADELARPTKWPAIDPGVARNVAVGVGGHHGVFPTNWDNICGPLGNEKWAAARRELLAELARLCGVTDLRPATLTAPEDQSVWMYVAGLTSVADWIGSNQTYFEPVGNAALVDGMFDLDNYFEKANSQAFKALDKLGWLDRADTSTPVRFAELFSYIKEPRPLQTVVAEIVAGMTEANLLIVEAPMGEGKTEAGGYATARSDQCRGHRTYVALPTIEIREEAMM